MEAKLDLCVRVRARGGSVSACGRGGFWLFHYLPSWWCVILNYTAVHRTFL